MHGERLAVVLTARSEPDAPDAVERWLDAFDRIHLAGLDLNDARRLTAHRGALPATVWAASGGNPLALLEMTEPNSAVFLDEPLQLPARLMRAYGRKLVGLPDATREALLLVAAAGRAGAVLDDALGLCGRGRADLEAAEDAGLVKVDHGVVRFTHPLVCSAVYHSSSPAVRRAAHRTMAAAYDGRRAPDAVTRRAFHLAAAATSGPDESVVAQLTDAARAAMERHSHATAAALFERAALLSPPGSARTRQIIDAAMAGQAAGTLDAVGPLLDTAIAETDDDELRTTTRPRPFKVSTAVRTAPRVSARSACSSGPGVDSTICSATRESRWTRRARRVHPEALAGRDRAQPPAEALGRRRPASCSSARSQVSCATSPTSAGCSRNPVATARTMPS